MDENDGPCRAGQSRHSSTTGLEETLGSALLVAVHGSGRGNGRNNDDKSAEKTVEKACFDYDEAWRTGFSHKAKRQEERTLKRMPCGACVSAVQRFCG